MLDHEKISRMISSESHINGDTLNIPLFDPRISRIKKIEISLISTRAADSILIEYDLDRDGWVVRQASVFSWAADDENCDSDWQEVAFIQAWARERPDIEKE